MIPIALVMLQGCVGQFDDPASVHSRIPYRRVQVVLVIQYAVQPVTQVGLTFPPPLSMLSSKKLPSCVVDGVPVRESLAHVPEGCVDLREVRGTWLQAGLPICHP